MFTREVLFAVCINILFITPLDLSEKEFFFTTNQHQSLDSICSKTKLHVPSRPKSKCKLSKLTMAQVRLMGEGFSATKKHGSKTLDHSPLAGPSERHVKQTPISIAYDWLILSCSQTQGLAVSNPVCSIQHRFFSCSIVCIYSLLIRKLKIYRKRKISVFENGKIT